MSNGEKKKWQQLALGPTVPDQAWLAKKKKKKVIPLFSLHHRHTAKPVCHCTCPRRLPNRPVGKRKASPCSWSDHMTTRGSTQFLRRSCHKHCVQVPQHSTRSFRRFVVPALRGSSKLCRQASPWSPFPDTPRHFGTNANICQQDY